MPNFETRALDMQPKTIDQKKRTVDIIISTGAGVLRRDAHGTFQEILELGGVDANRPNIPLLDSHRQDSTDRIFGRVVNVRREADALIATVRFNKTPSGKIAFEAVRDGDFSSVSVGYGILDASDEVDRVTGDRVRKVTSWELREVSIVAVPADPDAQIRSAGNMPNTKPKKGATPAPDDTSQSRPVVEAPPLQPIMTRAEVNTEVRSLADTFGLGRGFADQHIDAETPLKTVRSLAAEAVTERRSVAPTVVVTQTHEASPQEMVCRMGEAMYARAHPSHELSEPARPYFNLTNMDLARDCLTRAGQSTKGLSQVDTITRALHTTSDFPLIFGDTANRSLRQAYDAAPATLKLVAKQTSAKDFRAKTGVMLSEGGTLEKVGENGEYKHGSFKEGAESYAIDTYGKIFGISRKAIVNDDLSAFTNVSGKLGQAASEFEGQFLANLLTSAAGAGPNMADGIALFHSDHANLAETASTLDQDSLSLARLSMRQQKGLSGKPINVRPKYLIVPPELETTAERLLAAIQPTKSTDVNPFGGSFELLVEARLTDSARWYVVADPAQIEGLEYAYLQGEEGPQTETRAGFEVDGLEIKVRLDFGAAFMDSRGWYLNEGE